MSKTILYMAPGSCARVSAIALEEVGVDFESRVVRFMKGEHKSPEYKRYNPKGKVPALVHEGESLTENVAIITYLNERYGGLMPKVHDAVGRAGQLADLCFCASTLHPLVTRIRMPHFFAEENAAATVREIACKAMDEYFGLVETRLNENEWWYAEGWSAMDAYLFWVFWRVAGADYEVSRFPRYGEHAEQIQKRPSVTRALAREAVAEATLKREGLNFVPPLLA